MASTKKMVVEWKGNLRLEQYSCIIDIEEEKTEGHKLLCGSYS
jgi:hypothetical protein